MTSYMVSSKIFMTSLIKISKLTLNEQPKMQRGRITWSYGIIPLETWTKFSFSKALPSNLHTILKSDLSHGCNLKCIPNKSCWFAWNEVWLSLLLLVMCGKFFQLRSECTVNFFQLIRFQNSGKFWQNFDFSPHYTKLVSTSSWILGSSPLQAKYMTDFNSQEMLLIYYLLLKRYVPQLFILVWRWAVLFWNCLQRYISVIKLLFGNDVTSIEILQMVIYFYTE